MSATGIIAASRLRKNRIDWATEMVASYRSLNPEQATWFDVNPSIEIELYNRLLGLFSTYNSRNTASFIYLMQVSGNTTTRTISKSGATLRWDMQGQIFNQNNLPAATLSNDDIITVTSLDDWSGVSSLLIVTTNLKGACPSFNMPNTVNFRIDGNGFSFNFPTVTIPNCKNFQIQSNSFSGVFPGFTATALVTFRIDLNSFTSISNFDFISIDTGFVTLQSNAINQTSINTILNTLVVANKTTGTRIFRSNGGTNAAPSGQGITDKNTLISRGWEVSTN